MKNIETINQDLSKTDSPEKIYKNLKNKNIDVCAIYQAEHRENYEHNNRNDIPYKKNDKMEQLVERLKNTLSNEPIEKRVEKLIKKYSD